MAEEVTTWFLVEGFSTPLKADQLAEHYHIIRVIRGSYERAKLILRSIIYS